ncbi:AbiH family protein [Streptococcus salivarius]|uniref:AbiH family protein n=1 Tax=Streptococcus salivarius TaxID=1304 RepID=UPI002001AD2D|nr:AbiH family protein [Streptococcus salivarius]
MVERLFIIGNGFDIAHDLKTSYLYFKKFVYQQAYGKDKLLESLQSESAIKLYLERLDYEILEDIDDYSIPEIQMAPDGGDLYPDDEELYKLLYQLMGQITETEKFWSDFEEKLADFDKISITTTDITDKDGDLDGSKMANNANDTGETLAKYVLYSLNKLFKEWIEETYSEWAARILTKSKKSFSKLFKSTILNNPDAIFINFNYTKTLEDLYRIPEDQVIHLHGVIGGSQFIFGHGYEDALDSNPYDYNPLNVGSYLEEVVDKLKKPTDKVLCNYREFFETLSSIKEIYFIGFGIRSEENWVDSPYLKTIFKQTPNSDIILDSYYQFGDFELIKRTLEKLGASKANECRVIDTVINQWVDGE